MNLLRVRHVFGTKRVLIAFLILTTFSCTNIATMDSILVEDNTMHIGVPSTINKKVYIHYLPWFAEGKSGAHWADGVVNEPLIGYYNSNSWATHLYHILLSSVAGVDGAVINVRTNYDQVAFHSFVSSLNRIVEIYPEFDYSVAISYDDQDMTLTSAKDKMKDLKDVVIPTTTKYLSKNGVPVIFIFNYDGFLSSQNYRDIANEVFAGKTPILLKNELDLDAQKDAFVMNSIYPWIQGFNTAGSNWGEGYIDWFYNTSLDFELNNKIQFATGAVWPGFDDRQASWGQNRWIDRKDGVLYTDMWSKITSSTKPINWVILETWNDFNEGSELEPVKGTDSYKYIELTATNIAKYKNTSSNIDADKFMLDATLKIYQAAKLIEEGSRNYTVFYPKLKIAIEKLLQKKGSKSIELSTQIINGI